jgi:hypothetical protein
MVTAITKKRAIRYVPLADREITGPELDPETGEAIPTLEREFELRPNATTFLLRDMTPSEEARIFDLAARIGGEGTVDRVSVHTAALEALRTCLVGWESFLDEDGVEVEFPDPKTPARIEEALGWIDSETRKEVGLFAWTTVSRRTARKS